MGRSFAALALLAGTVAITSPAAAGPLADGFVDITIGVLSLGSAEPLIDRTERFPFSEPITLEFGPLGSVEAAGIVGIDPDPTVTYEFSVTNTTGDLLFGTLSVDFDISPVAGGVPGFSFLEVFYDGEGATGIGLVQHLPKLVSCDLGGPHGDAIQIEDLTLNAFDVLAGVVTSFEAGPVAIPDAPEGTFDRLCIQFSFNHLAPGDSAVFRGGTSIVPPPEVCDDSVDNDGDRAIDCDDLDCAEEPICVPEPAQVLLSLAGLLTVGILGGTRPRKGREIRDR
jgi:hypothetical protein